MKLQACLLGIAAAKKRSTEKNPENCIWKEHDGLISVTTVEGLDKHTKCFKKIDCPGAQVQAKIDYINLSKMCDEGNFVKFEYRVEREDFEDFHTVEESFCGPDDQGINLGQWKTMSETVFWSFEFPSFDMDVRATNISHIILPEVIVDFLIYYVLTTHNT